MFFEVVNFFDKVFQIVEVVVDIGKVDVGYVVEGLQKSYGVVFDFFGGNFVVLYFVFEVVGESLQCCFFYWMFFVGECQVVQQFVGVEGFVYVVVFDDYQWFELCLFVGGEVLGVGQVFVVVLDVGFVVVGMRIDDL